MDEKRVKMLENPDTDVRRGVVLEIRTHPDSGSWVVWKSEIMVDVLCSDCFRCRRLRKQWRVDIRCIPLFAKVISGIQRISSGGSLSILRLKAYIGRRNFNCG